MYFIFSLSSFARAARAFMRLRGSSNRWRNSSLGFWSLIGHSRSVPLCPHCLHRLHCIMRISTPKGVAWAVSLALSCFGASLSAGNISAVATRLPYLSRNIFFLGAGSSAASSTPCLVNSAAAFCSSFFVAARSSFSFSIIASYPGGFWYMKLTDCLLVTLSLSRSPMSSALRKNSCSRSNSNWACLFVSAAFAVFSSAMKRSR
mmetsp:Transcript_9003/g.15451  ORF Transcript_9003/g.15451 Transcript_9003/m.15451 type:complete len:204 (-) Transcript_9003:498-1109(-)